MSDLLQIAAFFLRCERSPWCKKRGPHWKKALESSQRGIDFPTTMVKYLAIPARLFAKPLKMNSFLMISATLNPSFPL
jgi:hypothetical protein